MILMAGFTQTLFSFQVDGRTYHRDPDRVFEAIRKALLERGLSIEGLIATIFESMPPGEILNDQAALQTYYSDPVNAALAQKAKELDEQIVPSLRLALSLPELDSDGNGFCNEAVGAIFGAFIVFWTERQARFDAAAAKATRLAKITSDLHHRRSSPRPPTGKAKSRKSPKRTARRS
jgi:hypothetical protein